MKNIQPNNTSTMNTFNFSVQIFFIIL